LFENRVSELRPVFRPRSIAVVGASSDEHKSGSKWILGLQAAGYKGALYPVSTRGGSIAGLSIYSTLESIPGEVEHVIASVPVASVMQLLDECIRKRARVVMFFTAGFAETGSRAGAELEKAMLEKARAAGLRIIGPNCIGSYCPSERIPLGPSAPGRLGTPGETGFISQSGGISAKLVENGIARHIRFGKGVSVGNSIDLDASDFLEYFGGDPETKVVGMYLEGTRNGRRLFQTLRDVCREKPVVVWKGGRTAAGAAAARSHTGSMASSAPVWSAALRQAGAIEARSLEELTDCLLLLQQLGPVRVHNVAVVGGLADGGGGISVSGSDACNDNALAVPELSAGTKEALQRLIGEVGSILRNPVDVSPAQFRGPDTLFRALEVVAHEPGIDVVLLQEDMDIMLSFLGQPETGVINAYLAGFREACGRPLVMVLPPGSAEAERVELENQLLTAGIPVFPTMARATRALSLLSHRPVPRQ
jgi:acyl-CoA synthetase (NDP forming)